jgi:hypothetical protein
MVHDLARIQYAKPTKPVGEELGPTAEHRIEQRHPEPVASVLVQMHLSRNAGSAKSQIKANAIFRVNNIVVIGVDEKCRRRFCRDMFVS